MCNCRWGAVSWSESRSRPEGTRWLTVPIRREAGQLIKDVRTDDQQDWRRKHLATLEHVYARAPFAHDMLALVEDIYRQDCGSLADLNIAATERTAAYFGLGADFRRSGQYPTSATSSAHLLELVGRFAGDTYVTGHGARNYLDHDLFAANGIEVRYMRYECQPYPQLHGAFTPYVSTLDLIANCGRDGARCIRSGSVNWKEFVR